MHAECPVGPYPLPLESRNRSLATQLPDRLGRFARTGRLHVGLEASGRGGQLVAVIRSAADPASARRRAARPVEARGHRHHPADRARDRADDGEPQLRQLPRDARAAATGSRSMPAASRPTPNNDANGQPLRAFHMANTCQLQRPAEPELERITRAVQQRDQRRLRAQRQRSGVDGLLGRRRHALLLRARQHVPAVRSVVRFGARADVSQPSVPPGGHRARDDQQRPQVS